MALVAVAAVASAGVAGVGPAQAADGSTTTIELTGRKDVSLGEAQKLVDAATKTTSGAPHVVAAISDQGKVPTAKQIDVLLAGKSVDDITLYRTVTEPGAASTVDIILEGTPLPAVVSYKRNDGGLTHVVVISCAEYCRIYVREYVIM